MTVNFQQKTIGANDDLAGEIQKVLDNLKGLSDEDAKNLFRRIFSLLKFEPSNVQFSIGIKHDGREIELRAEVIAETKPKDAEPFRIMYLSLPKMTKTLRREIVKAFVDWDEKYANFILIIRVNDTWQIISPVYIKETDRLELRVYIVGEGKAHRTPSIALSKLRLDSPGTPAIEVREKVNEAFRVKTLTEDFFKDYQKFYNELKDLVVRRYGSRFEEAYTGRDSIPKEIFVMRAAKTFTHSLLNRLMFIYFLQRKGWLAGRKDFIVWLWERYVSTLDRNEDGEPVFRDEFYSHYLRPLFFDAMNKPKEEKVGLFYHLPREVAEAFEEIPYFNGGLFEMAREGDVVVDEIVVSLPDEAIKSVIFDFLELYNFTVSEKTPLEVEIAVDPAMLGHIYESLIAQEEGARKSSGIFYTPEAEVDFMVRIAILEYLLTNLYEKHGGDRDEDEFRQAIREELVRFIWNSMDGRIRDELREDVKELLKKVRIVDPACGSGAFLVAAFNVLRELRRKLGLPVDYEGKKEIIRENIFGVDIKGWATRVAELRLWLALIEDEDALPERPYVDLQDNRRKELPILPNLKANIKTADSIVPKEIEVDGKRIVLPRHVVDMLRTRMRAVGPTIKAELKKIFDGEVEEPEKKLKETMNGVFRGFIENLYSSSRRVQATLDGEVLHNLVEEERELIRKIYEAYRNNRNVEVPFIWQIDFAQVFAEGGFDIVVSNPPYVRQEKIYPEYLDLNEFEKLSSSEQKKLKSWYKNAVQESVKEVVESIYGDKFELPGRSDLYAYFFVHSTMLLKPHGVLVYITSNSWLDVEFGVKLQEFFLRYGKLRYVFDSLYRSFEEADINTVITVFERKDVDEASVLDGHYINFVLLKKTFEELTTDDVAEVVSVYPLHVDKAGEVKHYEVFGAKLHFYEGEVARIRYITERELAKLGNATFNGESLGKYEGEKWGGLLIRAPEIFYKIVDKNKDKLVRLGEIAEVKFGIKTGANDFFYLKRLVKRPVCELCGVVHEEDNLLPVENGAGWKGYIEREFLRLVIKSPQDIPKYMVFSDNTTVLAFMCLLSKKELQQRNYIHALEYIKRAENSLMSCSSNSKHKLFYSQHDGIASCPQCGARAIPFYKRPSVANNRPYWWSINVKEISKILCMMSYNDRYPFWLNNLALCDARLYNIYSSEDELILFGLLNSSYIPLMVELFGRANLGEGALDFKVYEAELLLIINPKIIRNLNLDNRIKSIVREIVNRDVKTIFEEFGFSKPDDDFNNINIKDLKLNWILRDRRKLDEIIFEVLGLNEEEQLQVYRSVIELVKWRLSKAKSK
ncbi:Eco57I restriction-modification methylase domain-containing protein [Geoglobus acetivorans]|uniref:site-specific DNA-methyltransferase (adenine-specific) n=1 Tax=Geoglobus acetivorans TaxID=565033 RepID=A0ABZ3H084_GEOAI|nr:N-6 DNA methylase [Geoglobus acetivorans]